MLPTCCVTSAAFTSLYGPQFPSLEKQGVKRLISKPDATLIRLFLNRVLGLGKNAETLRTRPVRYKPAWGPPKRKVGAEGAKSPNAHFPPHSTRSPGADRGTGPPSTKATFPGLSLIRCGLGITLWPTGQTGSV